MPKEEGSNIVKMATALAIFFANDEKDIDTWLNEDVPALGLKPYQLMNTSEGRGRLIRCLETMKNCDF